MAQQRAQATAALEELRAALALDGISLPSAAVDHQEGRFTGEVLLDLGRVTFETAEKITDLLQDGLNSRRRSTL
ncbi:hypothetical protein C7C46_31190 [Streptomyces tateyamensis]|uniref:Uncharacterized protein n=1 Tax=Streptomyces tateyamensis TaxID=565073 RepID=A0A2V4MT49_9ACTN|nr:hypothetical protein C7C46_31190 [Streptomyces tateyamensis]